MPANGMDRADDAAPASQAILWWLLGFLAVAGLLLLGQQLWRDYQGRLDHAATSTANASRLLGGHARRMILSTDVILRRAVNVMAAAPDEAWHRDRGLWNMLKMMVDSSPGAKSLVIVDAEGDAVLSTATFPTPAFSVADREYFQAHSAGKGFHVGLAIRGKVSGEWFFTVSRPIRRADGRLRGVAIVGIDIDSFIDFEMFADFQRQDGLGSASSFLLIREDGRLLIRQPYIGEIEGTRVAGIAARAGSASEGTLTAVSPVDGVARIVSFKRDSMLPVIIAVAVPRVDVLRPWWATAYRSLVATSLIYGFLGMAAVLAWRSGRQEIAATEALKRSHLELEHKVVERTAALDAQRAAAQRSVEQLRFALDAAKACTWEWNVASGVTAWSEGAYRLYGLSDGALFSSDTWRELVHPDDVAAAEAVLKQAFATRSVTVQLEFRVIPPNGSLRWIAGIGEVTYDGAGLPLRVTGLNLDVTSLKQAETAMRDAKLEAERANIAKSKFLASASHDLRQPFQAMRLFHDVLLGLILDERARLVADRLSEAMRSGEDLLRALLDVSTLDAGTVRISLETFALDGVLSQVVAECEPQAQAKGLRLRYVTTSAMVISDRILLARMIRNLVVNAIRYTQRGGIVIGCRRHGSAVRVEVCDTGIGIAADQLTLVFEDFYQVGNDARDKSKGLGLGLSVVARTASLLGHPVGVRSRPHRGSIFSLTLPLAEFADMRPAAALQPPVTLM